MFPRSLRSCKSGHDPILEAVEAQWKVEDLVARAFAYPSFERRERLSLLGGIDV